MYPKQVPYIIAQEAGERFSFYGMRNILTVFLIDYLLVSHMPEQGLREASAKAIFHAFVMGVYFSPLLGGYLADRYFGKYRVILWLSLLYCCGHALLAIFDHDRYGFYGGLCLIALGSGGIKPCVAALVGDQFDERNKGLVKHVFALFYWSINLGSFFASLIIPKLLAVYGPSVAFGVPGVLMGLATCIFWLGRKAYVDLPPTGPNPRSFARALWSRVTSARPLDDASRAVLRVLAVFAPIPFFWMLFDQKASTWVVQAKAMDRQVAGVTFEPSQMQLVNPLLVMLLIPLTTGVIYPLSKRLGYELTPLRRMPLGMLLGACAYVIAGFIDLPVARGESISVLWQIFPYVVLTVAEILVSTTGLEFAYSQAPLAMKGTIMSFWNLTVALGNGAVALVSALNVFTGSVQFFFYAAVAALAALALAVIARSYQPVSHFYR